VAFIIPSLCEIISLEWDLSINRQNIMLIIEIKIILLHFRNPLFELKKEFIFIQRILIESIQQSLKKEIFILIKILPKNISKDPFNSLSWQIWEMYWIRKINIIDLVINLKEILTGGNVIYLVKKLIDDSLIKKIYYFSSPLVLKNTSILSLMKCMLNLIARLTTSLEFPIPYIIIHISLFCQNILAHLRNTKGLELQLLKIESVASKLI